jgi:hypothetical protein
MEVLNRHVIHNQVSAELHKLAPSANSFNQLRLLVSIVFPQDRNLARNLSIVFEFIKKSVYRLIAMEQCRTWSSALSLIFLLLPSDLLDNVYQKIAFGMEESSELLFLTYA